MDNIQLRHDMLAAMTSGLEDEDRLPPGEADKYQITIPGEMKALLANTYAAHRDTLKEYGVHYMADLTRLFMRVGLEAITGISVPEKVAQRGNPPQYARYDGQEE